MGRDSSPGIFHAQFRRHLWCVRKQHSAARWTTGVSAAARRTDDDRLGSFDHHTYLWTCAVGSADEAMQNFEFTTGAQRKERSVAVLAAARCTTVEVSLGIADQATGIRPV